ncbi:MAG: RNA polymerase sigma factor [Flammeovirgaceae bacterium]
MEELEEKVKLAVSGDKKALEKIVITIQDMIYNLALRMLWHPEDAKDAAQEILIKVITNLSSFKHRSTFKTWVYRLATNTLINFKKKKFNQPISFDSHAVQLQEGLSETISYSNNKAEQSLLIEEAKVGCSNAMLQCLNKESRITYIIGEILEFNSKEGATILQVSPENFRKRLSRARKSLHNFLQSNCGLVNPANTCRCHKKVDHSIKKGWITPNNLLFGTHQKHDRLIQAIEAIQNEVALYQSNPEYEAPEILLQEVKRIITAADNV